MSDPNNHNPEDEAPMRAIDADGDRRQLDILLRCSRDRDMSEWIEWRADNPDIGISLPGADLRDTWLVGVDLTDARLQRADLRRADLREAILVDTNLGDAHLEEAILEKAVLDRAYLAGAHLEGAKLYSASLSNARADYAHFDGAGLDGACLESARFQGAGFKDAELRKAILDEAVLCDADLEGAVLNGASAKGADLTRANLKEAILVDAELQGARFHNAHLEGASFSFAIVDGTTLFHRCILDRKTDFTGVRLDQCRIDPGLRRRLEHSLGYNDRRARWDEWYRGGPWYLRCLKRVFVGGFWSMSDYGTSIKRLAGAFFAWSAIFAFLYLCFPGCVLLDHAGSDGALRGPMHALYFSIVTMTTLGFGDIAANPDSWLGQVLLTVQVIIGYIILGLFVHLVGTASQAGPSPIQTSQRTEADE